MKKKIKIFISVLASIHVFYYLFLYKIGCNYKNISITLSSWNGIYGIILRGVFYKKTLLRCGDNLKIHHGSYICYPSVEIGNNCTVEEDCVISNCTIGDNVIIAANVSLMSGKNHHDINELNKTFYETQSKDIQKIRLGNNLWIGTRAIIMASISDGVVIGAGSVVVRDVNDINVLIAGVPAKLIKKRG